MAYLKEGRCNVIINILMIYYYELRIIRGYVPPADSVFPLPLSSCSAIKTAAFISAQSCVFLILYK